MKENKKVEIIRSQVLEDVPSSPTTSNGPPTFTVQSPDGKDDVLTFDNEEVVPVMDLPPPPDGGWGWVICFASFMCNMVLDGITYTFGVLLEPLVEYFGSNQSTVSWAGSLLAGVYLTSGPIVGGLVNKFGCRPVCMVGGIVSCLGLALSVLSPNVPILMLTYGVIGGFGLGLIYLPAVVAVGYYFESKRALATGISVCGSGVGTFLFAPLSTALLGTVGWRGANLVFAGFCLMCGLFGALMRPLELTAQVEEQDEEQKKFTVQLPDGGKVPHHPPVANMDDIEISVPLGGPSITIPNLPTIAEQSVTNQQKDEHVSVMDVFPKEDEEELPLKPPPQVTTSARHHHHSGRARTISEHSTSSPHKFQIKPVKIKSDNPEEAMVRNKSAPHFIVLDSNNFPRNLSTPGLGRLTRLSTQFSSTSGSQDQVAFGIGTGGPALTLQPGSRRDSIKTHRPIVRPLYRKDVFYGGSMRHLALATEQHPGHEIGSRPSQAHIAIHRSGSSAAAMPNVPSTPMFFDPSEGHRQSVISIPKFYVSRNSSFAALSLPRGSIVASHLSIPHHRKDSLLVEDDHEKGRPLMSVIEEMLSISLLTDPKFFLIAFSNLLGMLGFYVPFVFLPNMAKVRGVSTENANFLLSVIGISNTVGRVVAGWFSDFKWVNSLMVNNLAILLSGVCVMIFPLAQTYTALVVMALFYGFFVATFVSLTSIVLVDLLGLDNLTSAFGLLVLFRGLASMIGTPVAGALYDQSQSYDTPFYLAGGFLIISSFISGFIHIIQCRKAKT